MESGLALKQASAVQVILPRLIAASIVRPLVSFEAPGTAFCMGMSPSRGLCLMPSAAITGMALLLRRVQGIIRWRASWRASWPLPSTAGAFSPASCTPQQV